MTVQTFKSIIWKSNYRSIDLQSVCLGFILRYHLKGEWKKEGHDGLFTCHEGFRFCYKKPRELCSVYMAAWMGAGFGGGWIHVYVWLSPFTIHQTLWKHGLLTCYSLIQNKKLISIVGTNISELGVKFLEVPSHTIQDLQNMFHKI